MKTLSYQHKLNLHDFKDKALQFKLNIRWMDVWDSVFLQSVSFLVTNDKGGFDVYRFTAKSRSTFNRLVKWLDDNFFDYRKIK